MLISTTLLLSIPSFALGTPTLPTPPTPSTSLSGLTHSNWTIPESSTYAAVLASGENIFSPSAEDIVPPIYSSRLPPAAAHARYKTGGVSARGLSTRCDTTSSSAFYSDALTVVIRLRDFGNSWCCQTNSASSCTRMGSYMTAEISMCGTRDKCVKCGILNMAADETAGACRQSSPSGDRTGGKSWYDQQTYIAVNHMFKP